MQKRNNTNNNKRKRKNDSIENEYNNNDAVVSSSSLTRMPTELRFTNAETLKVYNVVSTAFTNSTLNLREVQLVTQGRYDSAYFPSVVTKLKNPSTTISFFASGKILVTGASHPLNGLLASHKALYKLNTSLGSFMVLRNFCIQNVVSSFVLGYLLNIDFFIREQTVTKYGTCNYNSDSFGGVTWEHKSGLVFVVFYSGRCVLTGGTSFAQSYAAYEQALPVLEKYRLGHEYKDPEDTVKRTKLNSDTNKDYAEFKRLLSNPLK